MKKLFLTLLLVLTVVGAPLLFAPCGSISPVKLMAPAWGSYEKLTYRVELKDNDGNVVESGTYTSEIETVTDKVVNVASSDITLNANQYGYILNTELKMDGGTTRKCTSFFYKIEDDLAFRPSISLAETFKDGVLLSSIRTDYSGKTASCFVKDENGNEKTENITLKSNYFDNSAIYYVTRGLKMSDTATSISYLVALPGDEPASMTTSVSGGATTKINAVNETIKSIFNTSEIECYAATLSRDTQLAGTNYYSYYAKSSAIVSDRKADKLPIRIVEGNTYFDLTSVETQRAA